MLRAGVGLQSVCFVAAALSLEVLGGKVGQGVSVVSYDGYDCILGVQRGEDISSSMLHESVSSSLFPCHYRSIALRYLSTDRGRKREREAEQEREASKGEREREREKDRPMYSQKG